MIDKIQSLAKENFETIREIRRHLHMNPELSFVEHNTASFIENKLSEMGIENHQRIAETGVTFTLEGGKPGKTIALRADIDALPIVEKNEKEYRSRNEGVMHACGHDVHTSSLLGVAKILNSIKSDIKGNIKFIFQPGEEKLPGGASLVIEEGFLKNPIPDRMLGQHVMPLIPAGKVGFRKGMYMASADEVYMTIKGKGGHAAMPESFKDPVIATSQILVALQQVVSRNANPRIPSVLSFGKVIANGATNVIPDQVKVEGTFRTYDEDWRNKAHKLIKHIAENTAKAFGVACDVEVRKGYPFLKNHEEYTEDNIIAARQYLGDDNVVDLDLWPAGEDFAYYSQQVDACFYRLGTRNESKGIVSGVHTPTFDIDEDALETGMGLMAWLTFNELDKG